MHRPLTALFAAAAILAAPGPARASEAEQVVRIVYTGFTGGLSSGKVDFAELWPFFRDSEGRDFEAGGFEQDNAFRRGDRVVYTEQGPLTLEDFRAFLAAGPVTATAAGPIALLTTDYAHVLDPATGPGSGQTLGWALAWLRDAWARHGGYPDARLASASRWQLVNRAAPQGGPEAALANPAAWEMVPGGAVAVRRRSGSGGRVLAIGRPLGEGLRRAALQRAWRAEAPATSLSVDLGNLLDPGVSDLSVRQRAFTLKALGQLGLDALVPAETELGLPPAEWARLTASVPVVAANLEAQDPTAPKPAAALLRELGGVKVALVGLVDDRAAVAAGVAGPHAAWRGTDPIAAAHRAIHALRDAGPDAVPDMIVLATNVRDERLQTLRHLVGPTAVIADLVGLPGDLFSETVALAGEARNRARSSYLVARSSPNRVGRLEAAFLARPGARPVLARLRNDARLVTDTLPHDERLHGELNELVDHFQRERRELILPDLREARQRLAGFPLGEAGEGAPHVDKSLWRRLIANAARRGTGAEIAVVRVPPMRTRVYGPVSRLVVEGWLELGDRLVQLVLPGRALKAIAAADAPHGKLAFAGFDPATGQVMGVAVGDDDLYRVTTTDLVARHAHYAEAFGERRLAEAWRVDGEGLARPAAAGEPLSLRDHVVRSLTALKARHRGSFDAAYLADLAALFSAREAVDDMRLSVRLEEGELLTNGVRGAGDPAFAQVRNARVTTPSSQALGGRGKLAVLLDSRDLALENRVRAVYKRTTLTKDGAAAAQKGEVITQETEDEVVLTSELRLKRYGFPLAGQPLTPFWSWNYTTEFKPDEADGVAKPRRQELAAIWGLLTEPGGDWKPLRAGVAIKNDLANPAMLEPGFYAAGGWEYTVAPWYPVKLRAGLEAFQYLPTATDTADRLGLAATLTGGVAFPLWERVTLNVAADWFLFRGKVPATERLGASLDLRVGVGYALAWKPLYGVWF